MVINDYAARQESEKMAVWRGGPMLCSNTGRCAEEPGGEEDEINNTTFRLLATSFLYHYFIGYFALPAA
jgi:hypothetical protein